MAVKPVSNGDPPCGSAATGMTTSRARMTVGRAHFDQKKVWIGLIRWTWNQRDDICASRRQLKSAACGANLTLTQSRCPITFRLDVIPGGYESGKLDRSRQ